MKYVSVSIKGLKKELYYHIPKHLKELVKRGMRVKVPIKNHLRTGYILDIKDRVDFETKPISSIESMKMTKDLFSLVSWIKSYYLSSFSKVFKFVMPKDVEENKKPSYQNFLSLKKSKKEALKSYHELLKKFPLQAQILELFFREKKGLFLQDILKITASSKSPIDSLIKKNILEVKKLLPDNHFLLNAKYFKTAKKKLTDEQMKAFLKILKNIQENRFAIHLIHGVTGSGKTEIYMQAIEETLLKNKSVIMLVPEIALTSQTIERFRARFDERIAIIHHRRSKGHRSNDWKNISSKKILLVIGARSAIFAPTKDLGLIVVDEEHDTSYKQSEESPTYNARDLAIMRAKFADATVILGSATPSFESYYNAKNKKYILSSLLSRPKEASLPKVTIVDMKKERDFLFSEVLLSKIKKRYEKGEQTILFLNRRGYSSSLICKACANVIKCIHCDISLTYHKRENILLCHSCNYTIKPPKVCPLCKSEQQELKGFGTEKVEAILRAIFPMIRTIRADRDTTKNKNGHEHIFSQFKAGKADVLIGTQMIAKGLHFPSVTLVGILNSDAALNIPDFRASENVFQLITQVAGRAGREDLEGEVIIQTYMPENRTIKLASRQDYLGFYSYEIETRELFKYPPFSRIIKITLFGKEEVKTEEAAKLFREELVKKLSNKTLIHPVIPLRIKKVKDVYGFFFLVRGEGISYLVKNIEEVKNNFEVPTSMKLFIDVDPIQTV